MLGHDLAVGPARQGAAVGTGGLKATEAAEPNADFSIQIAFDKVAGHPKRVFEALEQLIAAFTQLNKLIGDASSSVQSVMVNEDVDAGTVTVWLRDIFPRDHDTGSGSVVWKQLVHRYAPTARFAFIDWLNDRGNQKRPAALLDLTSHLSRLASQTRAELNMPAPSAADILRSAKAVSRGLAELVATDTIAFVSAAGEVRFDLSIRWDELDFDALAIAETVVLPPSPMILILARPDFVGEAEWEFRHGTRVIFAKLADETWLSAFHNRQVDVRPGDALRCQVIQIANYGFDHELISERFVIEEVKGTLEKYYARTSDLTVELSTKSLGKTAL